MTTNYNPICRATRSAWSELTTLDARRWYWQQLQASAALTHQGLTHVQRWLNASLEQSTVVELGQNSVSSIIEPAQVSVPVENSVLETTEVLTSYDSAALELEPGIASAESNAIATALELEPKPSVLGTTEPGASLDYEVLESLPDLSTATVDEPLLETRIPFNDELECGSPFLEEDDDSFFEPEEHEADSLLEGNLEPSASGLPPDLSARIQAYMQTQDSSVGPEDAAHSHLRPSLATPSSDSTTEAKFEEETITESLAERD